MTRDLRCPHRPARAPRILRDLTGTYCGGSHAISLMARTRSLVFTGSSEATPPIPRRRCTATAKCSSERALSLETRFRATLTPLPRNSSARPKARFQTVGRSLGEVGQQAESLPERLRAAHADYLDEIRVTTRSVHDELQSASSQNLQTLQQNQEATSQQATALVQQLSGANERIEKALHSLETGLARAGEGSAALGKNADLAAKSSEGLEAELEKLRGVLGPMYDRAPTVSGVLDAMGELEARIREGRSTEQTAMAAQQIGEIFRAITEEAAAARDRAAGATELMNALKSAVQKSEKEIRHTTDALKDLANEAKARADDLRQPRGFGFGFRNRNG